MDNPKTSMAFCLFALLGCSTLGLSQARPQNWVRYGLPTTMGFPQAAVVVIEGQSHSFDSALTIGRSKLDAGRADWVLNSLVPAMDAADVPKEQKWLVRELEARALLATKAFSKSAKSYASLAQAAEGPIAFRCGAIAEVLKDNADGMYVLREVYPPAAVLTDGQGNGAIKPGPASLAEPMVLEAALHDRAKKEIIAGRKIMEAAAAIERVDPNGAKTKYAQASQAFDRADWLVDGISRSYRVEIVRRQIAQMRKISDVHAEHFDAAMDKLGRQDLSGQEYRTTVLNLIQLLDNVRDSLQAVLSAAKAYPQELLLEVKWAEIDLKKMDAMRKVLTDEIDGQE